MGKAKKPQVKHALLDGIFSIEQRFYVLGILIVSSYQGE